MGKEVNTEIVSWPEPNTSQGRNGMNRKLKREWLLGFVIVLVLLGVGVVARASDDVSVRWDVVNVVFPDFSAGGSASASAGDGSRITVTGSGTFQIADGSFEEETGGGTWETRDVSNAVTGNGTFRVRGVVLFTRAPGFLPSPPIIDHIGNAANASAGLLVLRIGYSDGSRGILVVDCAIAGSPTSIVEGITATKSFVNYLNLVPGAATLFHVQAAHEGD
jgi:hypothetical protein